MLKLVTQVKETTQIKWNRIHKFKPSISLHIEMGPYIIKTADSVDDLLKAFRLRYEVFHREFREIMRPGLDVDKYDRSFDHLLIFHMPSNQLVGTYRLRSTPLVTKSYTAQEFTMKDLTGYSAPYLELGRACIHKEHRKGAVMSLLFRGIAEYMNRSEAQTLFGCSSVKITDPRLAALLYQYLFVKGFTCETQVVPTTEYKMPGIDMWTRFYKQNLDENSEAEAEALLPSLVKMYLKMGAKIACEPAFDEEFACIDLLTILQREQLEASLAKKYKVNHI